MSDTIGWIILAISIPGALIMSYAIMQSMKAGADALKWKTRSVDRLSREDFDRAVQKWNTYGMELGVRVIVSPIHGAMDSCVWQITTQQLEEE